MKNILLVTTGGTIGSAVNGNIIDTSSPDGVSALAGGAARIKTLTPFTTLSENMTLAKLSALCNLLINIDVSNYDGIIITHGTDTLAFTAAAVAMALGESKKTVVLVSANHPIEDARSNARVNIENAVRFIETGIPGVFCCYKNSNGGEYVFRAATLNEADFINGDFSDFRGIPFGVWKDGRFERISKEQRKCEKFPLKKISFENRVLIIKPYPGIEYSAVNTEGYSAVLHTLYHASTACTEGELIPFIKRCKREEIPFYIAPVHSGDTRYATTDALLSAGAVPLYEISPVAAYIKLIMAYNQSICTPEEFLSKTYHYECL